MSIVIVDYGMGNVGSIANMLRKLGVPAVLSDVPEVVAAADRLILPGVGSFDVAMENLRSRGLVEPLTRRVMVDGAPLLGICLGMQLLAESSEEGSLPGLGWVAGRVTRLPAVGPDGPLPIPHMGWSKVRCEKPSAVLTSLGGEARYYFVHSYAFRCADPADVLGVTDYGESFTSAVEHDNVIGAQFHPEKSHRHGMALLADFAAI